MDFELTNLLLGAAGALLAVYLLKTTVVPEFRSLWDVTDERTEKTELHERIDRINDEAESGPTPERNQHLEVLYERLDRVTHRINRATKFQRGVGILCYVGLGAVFAGLFAKDLDIGDLPEEVKAIAMGATWTSYVAAWGLRGEQEVKDELANSVNETKKKLATVAPLVEQSVAVAAGSAANSAQSAVAAEQVGKLMDELQTEVRDDLAKVEAAQVS